MPTDLEKKKSIEDKLIELNIELNLEEKIRYYMRVLNNNEIGDYNLRSAVEVAKQGMFCPDLSPWFRYGASLLFINLFKRDFIEVDEVINFVMESLESNELEKNFEINSNNIERIKSILRCLFIKNQGYGQIIEYVKNKGNGNYLTLMGQEEEYDDNIAAEIAKLGIYSNYKMDDTAFMIFTKLFEKKQGFDQAIDIINLGLEKTASYDDSCNVHNRITQLLKALLYVFKNLVKENEEYERITKMAEKLSTTHEEGHLIFQFYHDLANQIFMEDFVDFEF
ncbi:MAG: hypothetical protein SZ59_C0002G0259 [candidate division TM6 bacterium GW2011_GWF2_28_16]|nr:MAG: hypothetical protein SZ59_C0002G0259 [candidate division TM6 bacterium GW2011_GWF2_28_16]